MAKIVNDTNFKEEVVEYNGVVLVDFFAEWCGPCRMLSPMIDELTEEMKDKAKIVKVDVDDAQNTAMMHGVMSIPTLIIYKNGEVKETMMGVQGKAVLSEKINSYL